jgi:hypothetical protein
MRAAVSKGAIDAAKVSHSDSCPSSFDAAGSAS